jgi:hypothetical protein
MARKDGKCFMHRDADEVEIVAHVAPSPMELLANITVKLEPGLGSNAELDVEIMAHNQPTELEQLANITVKAEPMDEGS